MIDFPDDLDDQFPLGDGTAATTELVICPYCGAGEVARVELSETGTLWSWTAVTAAPPGYGGDVPFGFGVVELPEGLRVITRVEQADPARLSFGIAVRFALAPLHTDDDGTQVVTYTFAPADSS